MDWSIHTNNGTAVEFRIEEQDSVLLSRDPSCPVIRVTPDYLTHGEGQHERYELLYEGCPIREDQSIILISLFAARHHLSDVAIKDLLKLIDLHCPSLNNCTKSEYR